MSEMAFGIGDKVKILHSSDLYLVGKISVIASVCGKGTAKYYHLKIDGERKAYWPQNLQLIEKCNSDSTPPNNPKERK